MRIRHFKIPFVWRAGYPNRFSVLAALVLCACCSTQGLQANPDYQPYELAQTHVHTLHADGGALYSVSVALPLEYDGTSGEVYPVLYVLDGRILFAPTVAAYQAQRFGRAPEPVIIVGIDYAAPLSERAWMARRSEDLTPDNIPEEDKAFSEAFGYPVKTGGASDFRQFLAETVIPFVEQSYSTSPSRGLFGFSLAGLFAANELYRDDRLFDRYSISSAALWWNDFEISTKSDKEFPGKNPSQCTEVLITYGGSEVSDIADPSNNLFQSLTTALNGDSYASLKVFEGEDHMSVVSATASHVIRSLYKKERPCRTTQ